MDSVGKDEVQTKAVTKLRNKHYYDEFSATYERHRHEGYHAFIDELTTELVSRYMNSETRLLEAGCGTGLILNRLRPHAKVAVGVDLSSGMLRRAVSRSLQVVQGSVNELPFADATFDVVCSFKVLAHVEQIDLAMRELSRVLRPGGYLLAEFYNTLSLRYLIKRLKRPTAISHEVNDEAVYTRYDSLPQIRSYLPSDVQIQTVHGIRVVTPFSQAHRWPVIGPALRMVERHAAVLPGIRRFGGFLLVVARKDG
ncbi:MAG: class I SAM-dependent methyltransferase [Deltaproteobacteria bacterium]|jgi:ubiquinone/menaquinone biosynthesis C-methylase UbiE|nr:class I SAM-dependent methyltransferase [Deltaproteobacteria bacterium]